MTGIANRLAFIVPAIFVLQFAAAAISPAPSRAAECGQGTVYDAPTGTCVVAEAQPPPPPPGPPPPPPPPAWSGPRPYVSASICAPLRFLSLCVGI